MRRGFVFGKFLPFHKGHEAMINFALTQCDFLSVLVCCSDKELIPCHIRKDWIVKTFAKVPNVEVRVFNYMESELPNSSESSIEISRIWSEKFKVIFKDHEVLFTSEPYGEYVASFMGIRHIPFDNDRKQFPVSASAIRNDIFSNWGYLPDAVKPFFALKVVILGTESTGKSTLTTNLAKHFNCSEVQEAGRDLIADSKEFEFDDLYKVANEHARRISEAMLGPSPLVIIDTDINITRSYARFIFKRELDVSHGIQEANRADLYLYLNNDVDHFQDGTRLDPRERDNLDDSHRNTLQQYHIEPIVIGGSWEQRFEKAKSAIEALIRERRIGN